VYGFLTYIENLKHEKTEMEKELDELKIKLDNIRKPMIKLNMGHIITELDTIYHDKKDKFKQMDLFFQGVNESSDAAGFKMENISELKSRISDLECTVSAIDQDDDNTTLMPNNNIAFLKTMNGNDNSGLYPSESTRIDNNNVNLPSSSTTTATATNHKRRESILFHRNNIEAKSLKLHQTMNVPEDTDSIKIYQSMDNQQEIGIVLSSKDKRKSHLVKIEENSTVHQAGKLEATFTSAHLVYHLKFDVAHARDEFVQCFIDAVEELVKLKLQSSIPNGNNNNINNRNTL